MHYIGVAQGPYTVLRNGSEITVPIPQPGDRAYVNGSWSEVVRVDGPCVYWESRPDFSGIPAFPAFGLRVLAKIAGVKL